MYLIFVSRINKIYPKDENVIKPTGCLFAKKCNVYSYRAALYDYGSCCLQIHVTS